MKYKKLTGILVAGLFLVSSAFSAEQYEIDKAHSRVGFAVKHMVLSTVRGAFFEYSGTVLVDENDITKSSVEGTVKVASINTNNQRRDDHLRSSDFFDVEKYPDIKFKSKKITREGNNYVMIADLTIRDVTKEVRFPFTITGIITDNNGKKRIGVDAEFVINRQEYGVSWSKIMDNGGLVVSDEVKIELSFQVVGK